MARRRPRSRRRSKATSPRRSRPPAKEAVVAGPEVKLLEMKDIGSRIESVLEHSPADETEVVWLEVRRGTAQRKGPRVELRITPERTVLVRVLDLGRVGSYRTGSDGAGELSDGVRFAMGQARAREPLSGLPHLPADNTSIAELVTMDPELTEMSASRMRSWLLDLPAKKELVQVDWSHARVLVFNSRRVRRAAEVTAIGLQIKAGTGPGTGRSVDASRSLGALDPKMLIERARYRNATGPVGNLPSAPFPVVLAPAAVIEMIDLLSRTSFSAISYYEGTSFLREHINIQVFDRRVRLKDDGTDLGGLPFPFDLEGTAKYPVDLIAEGAPKTPTLDQRQAAVLGLSPTAHAIGGNNARAENLFLLPGTDSWDDLLAAADGGVFVGWLENLEVFEPQRVGFRARACGVRLIQNGVLGPAAPDFIWEDSLLREFSALEAIGSEPARRLGDDGYLGGISAPAVAVSDVTPKS